MRDSAWEGADHELYVILNFSIFQYMYNYKVNIILDIEIRMCLSNIILFVGLCLGAILLAWRGDQSIRASAYTSILVSILMANSYLMTYL